MSNTRSFPWRNKAPPELLEKISSAMDLKLFLVQEHGPTAFLFKDTAGNKIKIQIGAHISCSCNPSGNDHCIHTLYTLLKVFKVKNWLGVSLFQNLLILLYLIFFREIKRTHLYDSSPTLTQKLGTWFEGDFSKKQQKWQKSPSFRKS